MPWIKVFFDEAAARFSNVHDDDYDASDGGGGEEGNGHDDDGDDGTSSGEVERSPGSDPQPSLL